MTDLPPPQARTPAASGPLPEYMPPYFRFVDETEVDLAEYARLLWRSRRLIGSIVVAAGLLAATWALTMPPVYRAEAVLVPVQHGKGDGISGLLGQLGDLAALVETYVGAPRDRTSESIATLNSRILTRHFIQQRDLKPILFADRWDAQAKAWRAGERVPTDAEAVEQFDREIRQVRLDRRTGLVTLAVEWTDPVLAAQWANALVKEVNDRRRNDAINETRTSIEYLQRQLARNNTVEIQQALYRLIEAQTKTMTVASTRAEYAFRVVDPAVAPERRVRPQRTLMVALGMLLGLVIAVAVALVRNALHRKSASAI
ncbi:MAG: GNVR domain-containing protein [Gammaproteobacteria bacterium]